MRISTTTIVSVLALVLAVATTTVSAQDASEACKVCVAGAAMVASPTCSLAILQSETPLDVMTPAEKSCLCPLASSNAWIQICITSADCTAAEAAGADEVFSNLKPYACAASTSAPAPPPTSRPSSNGVAPPKSSATVTPGTTVAPGTPNPSTTAPPKNDASGALWGASSKVVTGAALVAVAVAGALL
ncbi:hypothetical protein BGX29_000384 [Mortierella sp. GBA35]|nr:hypothetical protein BGX29_000384 [Mortierella sp. GBA35]